MAYKQQKLTSHSSGGWKAGVRVPVWSSSGKRPFLSCRQASSYVLTWQKVERGKRKQVLS